MTDDELRALAMAAPPGAWVGQMADDGYHPLLDVHGKQFGDVTDLDALEYIANVSPDVLLALLDRLAKAEGDAFAMAAQVCIVDGGLCGDEGGSPYCSVQRRLAAAERERDIAIRMLAAWCADLVRLPEDGSIDLPTGTKLYTAPPAAVPVGWKLVPEVPTDKMMLMGGFSFCGKVPNDEVFPNVRKLWAAMLAAAPAGPVQNPPADPHESTGAMIPKAQGARDE